MTTLYTDRPRNILVIHKEISDLPNRLVRSYTSDYMEKYDATTSTKKYITGAIKTLTDYIGFTYTVAQPLSLYHVLDDPITLLYVAYERIIHELKSDIKIRKGLIAGYRRYRLNETDTHSTEGAPFCIAETTPGDSVFALEQYRMSAAYDLNPVNEYPAYTLLLCVQCDEGVEGGNVLFYPRYNDESSLITSYLSPCTAVPRQTLDIPFRPGMGILLSGHTRHTLESVRLRPGVKEGTFIMVMVDFFGES